jgi:hypothetical protein
MPSPVSQGVGVRLKVGAIVGWQHTLDHALIDLGVQSVSTSLREGNAAIPDRQPTTVSRHRISSERDQVSPVSAPSPQKSGLPNVSMWCPKP